jgi:serine/threonine protein phosphatase PrpC
MTPPSTLCMRTAALTHVGLRRAKNEDCIAIGSRTLSDSMTEPWVAVHRLDQPCICLVADGMGGHPAGDVASRLAAQHIAAGFADFGSGEHGLIAAIRAANRALFTEMARSPAYYGMGTTLAGIVAQAEGITALNVGDSRVYGYHAGTLAQLSFDHSTELDSMLMLSRGPARMLNQCLGGFASGEEIDPHLVHVPLQPGRSFLICSDGLHDMLSDALIRECLSEDLVHSVGTLFERAMDQGGIDNISIIYARIEDAEAAPAGA